MLSDCDDSDPYRLSDSDDSDPYGLAEPILDGWSQCSHCDRGVRVSGPKSEIERRSGDHGYYCLACADKRKLEPAPRPDLLQDPHTNWHSFILQLRVGRSDASSFEIIARRMSGEVATAMCCEKEISSSDFAQRLLTVLTRLGALPPYCMLRLILPNGSLLKPDAKDSLLTKLQQYK